MDAMRHETMIFLTGAAVLALEVLASRIMTPYFGVSLFIWAGILSITLTFLAVGYYAGSAVSRRLTPDVLELWYLGAPAVAAISIVIGALLYPVVFPLLTRMNLVVASFLGGALLLTAPLIALSAMNPLLVAIQRSDHDAGDAGAGRVFFISTIGSVAGVLITAFVFIPLMRNFTGILTIAMVLCGLVVTYALRAPLTVRQRSLLAAISIVAGLLAALLAWGQRGYLEVVTDDPGFDFAIEHEYTSVFGNIKVIKLQPRTAGAEPLLAFLQDGLVQNRALENGASLSLYTYFLEALAFAYMEDPKSALVLGLGAGIVPRNLGDEGLSVTAVEINRDSLLAAETFFHFEPQNVAVEIEDARTYVRHCDRKFDLAVVDLFNGDNTPDYLMTREFFRDLASCMTEDGVMVVNAFFDQNDERPNQRVRATVKSVFGELFEYRSPDGAAFLAATRREGGEPRDLRPTRLPPFLREDFARAAANVRQVGTRDIAGVPPITDDHNVFKVLFSDADRRLRRNLAEGLPVQFLVN